MHFILSFSIPWDYWKRVKRFGRSKHYDDLAISIDLAVSLDHLYKYVVYIDKENKLNALLMFLNFQKDRSIDNRVN